MGGRSRHRLTALLAVCTFSAAAPAAAQATKAPLVEVTVATKNGTLIGPLQVRPKLQRITASRRTCTVPYGTALAAMIELRRKTARQLGRLSVTAQGRCSKRARSSDGIYLRAIGKDRAHGADGWVYDLDGRRGRSGAADPLGPRGNGKRIKSGQRLHWRWCSISTDPDGGCGAELRLSAPATAVSGAPLVVGVKRRAGADGRERSVVAPAGIEVVARKLGGARSAAGVTDASGRGTLMLPPGTAGRVQLITTSPDGAGPAGRLVVVR